MSDQRKSLHFEDHFSGHSEQYAQHRPKYPDEVYAYLASLAPGRSLAWDCGTGSGQAAVGLANHFDKIYATDASAEQISAAHPHENVDYHVEPAERIALEANSADLITVAVAIHWFNFDQFYREVKRVLKPGGILAAWTYNSVEISPEIDEVIWHYYGEVVGTYWPKRIHYLEERYETLPFPFEEITPPEFRMEINWNLIQLAGFLDSWSATQRYKAQNGNHPLEIVWPQLREAWGDENEARLVRWPLYFRIGRNESVL